MKKINLKLFLINSLSFLMIFSLFFISSLGVLAQTDNAVDKGNEIKVETRGYSIIGPNTIVFTGDYYNNKNKENLTTYFEYKKDDNNLDDPNDRQMTIIIQRPKPPKITVDKTGVFYTSQEVKIFSTYYFRAVGCIEEDPVKGDGCSKDDSVKKFYGEILSFNLSPNFVTPYTYAYTRDASGTLKGSITSYEPPLCSLLDGICDKSGENLAGSDIILNDTPNDVGNNGTNDNSKGSGNVKKDSGVFGLVDCGTLKYGKDELKDKNQKDMEGVIKNPCGFYNVLDLINRVVKFILFDLAVPLAAVMFAYAGFELVTSGGSTEKKSKAKTIFTNVAVGLILAAGAFLIVETVLSILGYDQSWNWFGF